MRSTVSMGAGPIGLLIVLGGCGNAASNGGILVGDDDVDGAANPGPGDDADGADSPVGTFDGGVFVGSDAGASDAGAGTALCDLGAAGSFATADDLNLFGQIVYYEDGGALPPGRYRATYVDGCMKYDFVFGWQVQATAPAPNAGGFWFVGDTSDDRIAMAPGQLSMYGAFDDCVTANLATPPQEFDFDGGKMGVWLSDNPYSDNLAGTDGRNPKWQLTYLAKCPPNLGPR